MCRLLQAVVRQKVENFNFEESLHYHRQEHESIEEVPESSVYPLEKEIYREDNYATQHIPSGATKRVRLTPSLVDLRVPSTKTPSNLGTGKPIKEGLVEKRGHSVAFLMWPK